MPVIVAPELPELISVPQAQAEFALSRATLYRYLRQGRLNRYLRGAGRQRLYLDRAELRRLTKIRIVKHSER